MSGDDEGTRRLTESSSDRRQEKTTNEGERAQPIVIEAETEVLSSLQEINSTQKSEIARATSIKGSGAPYEERWRTWGPNRRKQNGNSFRQNGNRSASFSI